MYLQLDVEALTAEQATSELDAAEAKGPILENVGGIAVYDISDACARTIAKTYGVRDTPSRSYLWMLGNGDQVGPEYVHDDIDAIMDAIDATDIESDAKTRAATARALEFLKGWLYMQVHNSPHDFVRHPAQFQLKLRSISVRDLIGRFIANRKGREFKIVDVRYDLEMGKVTFELAEVDEDGIVDLDDVRGISELEGWTVL
jgi:hypothetical protein